ncbi:MAG: hypothetical protein FJZ90_03040 [Chloroflexi bacterium]|nr:hypothetical protein [Chloroflexota bacterium]
MMFEIDRYVNPREGRCPTCGASSIGARCLEAHSWQEAEYCWLLTKDCSGCGSAPRETCVNLTLLAEGEDHEMECGSCGAIFWSPGRAFVSRPDFYGLPAEDPRPLPVTEERRARAARRWGW